MNTFFKELFDYSNHFNHALIKAMEEHSNPPSERSLQLISHIVNVHHIWNCKIEQVKPFYTSWDCRPLPELAKDNRKNYFDSLLIIDQYNLDKVVTYTTANGTEFSDSVRDMLFHVVNHSTYHRAQVATDFRQSGIEPLMTDYIYYRMRNNHAIKGSSLPA